MTNGSGGNGAAMALATPAQVNSDLLERHGRTGDMFWRGVALCSVLFVLGIIGFLMRLSVSAAAGVAPPS